MAEQAQPLQRTAAQIADSIAQLTGSLTRLKDEKKAKVKDYNERIKELEEIIDGERLQYEKLKAVEEASL